MSSVEGIWTTEKLNDKAYAAIKEKIINHELKPGTRLVDSQLAEKYGISRTPVRDAIRKLAEEGLVVSSDKKGYFVFKATRQDIIEIFELRLILDQAIVRKLIGQVIPSNFPHYMEELAGIEARLRQSMDNADEHFPQYDGVFHDSLVRLANNTRITSVYDENCAQCKGFRQQTSMDQQRMARANQMHFKLLDALKNLDLEDALKAVDEHVEMSRKGALADLERWEHPA